MKILVIASSIGNTAPGKVFSAYIKRLAKDYQEIDIISLDSNETINSEIIQIPNVHPRLKKLSISCFGLDLFDYYFAYNLQKKIQEKSYDVVVTMMSAHNFLPLYVGSFLKGKNIKWINYCVDAVPAPKGWGLSDSYTNGLIKMIRKYMAKADKIYFSNEVMLQYQLNLLNGCFNGEAGVLYTLPDIEPLTLPVKEKEEFTLLYTGGIYQARKVDQLLLAVEKLLNSGLNIKLNFVGTNPNSVDLNVVSPETRSHIEFFGYTRDLLPFYAEADLLVDIDADIENDVFISSKFFNYLMINRKILCITGQNSPVTKFICDKKIPDVSYVSHKKDDIYASVNNILLSKNSVVDRNVDFFYLYNISV
ncbi:hypothetical protein ACNQO8_14705 [Acinetobacter calcoaceticus]|uniref:hypothetical protein n=1 Tax=Acinetobacter calcoaceticus TaxID=471 RepID=UPI0033422AF2